MQNKLLQQQNINIFMRTFSHTHTPYRPFQPNPTTPTFSSFDHPLFFNSTIYSRYTYARLWFLHNSFRIVEKMQRSTKGSLKSYSWQRRHFIFLAEVKGNSIKVCTKRKAQLWPTYCIARGRQVEYTGFGV